MARRVIPPQDWEAFLDALRQGTTREAACAVAGINRQTFYNTYNGDEAFKTKVQEAESRAQKHYEYRIYNDASWQSAAWWLERRRKEEYAKQPEKVDAFQTWWESLTEEQRIEIAKARRS